MKKDRQNYKFSRCVVFFFFNENLQYLASVFIAGFCLEDCDVASQTWPSPSRLKVRASPTGSQPPRTHTVPCGRWLRGPQGGAGWGPGCLRTLPSGVIANSSFFCLFLNASSHEAFGASLGGAKPLADGFFRQLPDYHVTHLLPAHILPALVTNPWKTWLRLSFKPIAALPGKVMINCFSLSDLLVWSSFLYIYLFFFKKEMRAGKHVVLFSRSSLWTLLSFKEKKLVLCLT